MSKVTRTKPERGVKLVTEHVHKPLAAIATKLNAANIETDQLERQWAPFRLNYSIPFFGPDRNAANLSIPFALPPLQDTMAFTQKAQEYVDSRGVTQDSIQTSPDTSADTPQIFLDEVSFSMDLRDTTAAIASPSFGSNVGTPTADAGKLYFAGLMDYDIRLSIVEKDPVFFMPPNERNSDTYGPTRPDPEIPRREVWSTHIPSSSFANDVFTLNPYVVTDINEQIDPWKTYVLSIHAPGVGFERDSILAGDRRRKTTIMVSIEVSLKFRAKVLGAHMDAGVGTANAPIRSDARVTRTAAGVPVSITTPADNTVIEADTADGVNTSIATIDEVMRAKLYTGANEHAEMGETIESISEEIEPTSAYEVITVPLFQNANFGGISIATAQHEPYSKEALGLPQTTLIDRRIIPINYPFQIEHVLVALNFQGFSSRTGSTEAVYHPRFRDCGFQYRFGVGVGTGLEGDGFSYSQVAGDAGAGIWILTPGTDGGTPDAPPVDALIDRLRVGPTKDLPLLGQFLAEPRCNNLSLWCLPLNTGGPSPSTGYPAYLYDSSQATNLGTQGPPCFVGNAWTPTQARQTPLTVTVPPGTEGLEQWIEVRCRIDNLNIASGLLTPHDDTIVVGYQGFFVYIIGRKYLVS
tara:strand:+ start:736 stop:2646 length:1911 start_codon:yes stop_codon:yes gene_type:complete